MEDLFGGGDGKNNEAEEEEVRACKENVSYDACSFDADYDIQQAADTSLAVHFDSLRVKDEPLPSPSSIRTFNKARDLFLKANKNLEEAKTFYVLDGFVTDHCRISREISRSYRFLCLFEQVRISRSTLYDRH